MTDYKLVPMEPTKEMLVAYCGAQPSNIAVYLSDGVEPYKAMLAAAPAVQGEPVAWVTVDTVDGQEVNGKPRRIWWENNEGVGMPIYAAPQPAEQQPDVAQLVEALEASTHRLHEQADGEDDCRCSQCRFVRLRDAALATHRKQGGEA